MRSIDTERDVVELLEFVGAKMPEEYVSPYSGYCELYRRIAKDGLRCRDVCPFIGVVVPSTGEHIGISCCPMFRISKWRQGRSSSVNMTAIVDITQRIGEL